MNDLNLQNAEYFGTENQMIQFCEELAELTQAASKWLRLYRHDPTLRKTEDEIMEDLIEELADVSIMTDQIKHLLEIPEKKIREKRSNKIFKTAADIHNEKWRHKWRREQTHEQDNERNTQGKL